ncbi:MAG: signal recognition particle-docking protein FtsY [Lachnospiraceae bacterium]|nr:signal recognition particle-docking protein FtsY [Lachnospiraceae bacterium]
MLEGLEVDAESCEQREADAEAGEQEGLSKQDDSADAVGENGFSEEAKSSSVEEEWGGETGDIPELQSEPPYVVKYDEDGNQVFGEAYGHDPDDDYLHVKLEETAEEGSAASGSSEGGNGSFEGSEDAVLEGYGEGVALEDGEEEAEGEDAVADETEEEDAEEEAGTVKEKKKGFFARLREGLAKTRANIARGFDRLFTANEIDEDFYEELEEILIMGDIGVNSTTEIIERLREQVKERHLKKPVECKDLLIQSIREQMEVGETAYDFETQQSIIMVIGVNGVGKTTTVGKLAWKLKDDGKKVLIAAADTFRAAAGDQLAEWARRAGVPMIGGKEGADPASVVYDAVNAAKARGVDVLLIDTAGRLHNKKNLMEELRKMNRIIDKEYPDAHRENLIVLDGTTGQNALAQAREFGDVTDLTGIVLTKMDGTAKGGIAVAIQSELGIPVKYIGVGETTQDLQKFDPDEFVRALFDVDLGEDDVMAGESKE